jgi:aminoglycoside 2'-N-acetyltransferase I
VTSDRLELSVVPLEALSPAARSAIVAVCTDALRTDCGRLFDYLSSSTHVIATIDGRLVGHACWTTRRLAPDGQEPLRTAWVDAMVVAPDRQRLGVGTSVMRRLAERTESYELRGLGTEQMAFFERIGWERWRGPTPGVHHDPLDTLMILRTTATPALDLEEVISADG